MGNIKFPEQTEGSTDRLARQLVLVAAWVVMTACIAFVALHLWYEMESLPRLVMNVAGVLLGATLIWLSNTGREKLASMLLIWVGMMLVEAQIALTGGVWSPLILYFPMLIIMSAWLLGVRQTIVLSLLIAVSLVTLYFGADLGIPTSSSVDFNAALPVFYLYIMLLTTLISLLARKSFADRIEHALKLASDLERSQSELFKKSLVVEQSPVGIVIGDSTGRLEYSNPMFHTDNRLGSIGRVVGKWCAVARRIS